LIFKSTISALKVLVQNQADIVSRCMFLFSLKLFYINWCYQTLHIENLSVIDTRRMNTSNQLNDLIGRKRRQRQKERLKILLCELWKKRTPRALSNEYILVTLWGLYSFLEEIFKFNFGRLVYLRTVWKASGRKKLRTCPINFEYPS
jgi:hypothetical protein